MLTHVAVSHYFTTAHRDWDDFPWNETRKVNYPVLSTPLTVSSLESVDFVLGSWSSLRQASMGAMLDPSGEF